MWLTSRLGSPQHYTIFGIGKLQKMDIVGRFACAAQRAIENITQWIIHILETIPLLRLAQRSKLGSSPEQLIEIQGDIRRRKDTVTDEDLRLVFPDTLYEVLECGKRLSDNGKCLGYRPKKGAPYVWLSYEDIISRSKNFGAGLLQIGGKAHCEYFVGIFAKSGVEWTVAEYGCLAYGMVTAPLYDSLGPEACQQTTEFYDIEIMICGDAQITALLHGDRPPWTLRTIVVIDQITDARRDEITNAGLDVFTIQQVEELGRQQPRDLQRAKPQSLATIIFTSGTTGPAKAVMHSHADIFLSLKSILKTILPNRFSSDDTHLAYLPSAHIFGRATEKLMHLHGGKIGYLYGGPENIAKDAMELRPTYFAFVPRLLNKFYDDIQVDLKKSFLLDMIAKIGYSSKKLEMQQGIYRNDSIADRLVFGKYRGWLGGNVKVCMTGSAATDGEVMNFMRAVLGCYIHEFYGQTEACGPITCSSYGDSTTDNVGIPFFDVEVKLVDVPEMGYMSKEQSGEVCTRSKFTTKGYYKMPEKTAEAIDEDKWLHTGDIGMWLPNGNLKIFDRKKHIFKLSQGEYLAPERLEAVFSRSELLESVFIDGNSRYPFAVALVFPNSQVLQWMRDKADENMTTDVERIILDELTRMGREGHLKSYEIPKRVHILDEPFSEENGCLTPSQKTRRESVRVLYRSELQQLYSEAS